mgnify:CR=1 FL=1
MQNVSRKYKESMKEYIRNRGYIRAVIGIINSQAQRKAKIDLEKNELLYISNLEQPFSGSIPERIYAMPEENFTCVDGSMYFMPLEGSGYQLYNNGLVSSEILGEIYIDFGGEEFDIKGLTVDFGNCFPVDFIVETNRVTRTYSGNQKRDWMTEDTFNKTAFFKITPIMMINGQGRLRVYRFSCGMTNTFTNDDVISFSNKEYVSPVTETIPSVDSELVIKNYDMYFSPDNSDSAIAYMEVGQEVRVSIGYDVSGHGNIEWLPERRTFLKSWKADESKAVFTSSDVFDYMSGTYYRGEYKKEGISLYDLAADVFEDAGIADYFIDSYLREIIVNNPLPAVSYPSALQIIANAGRCILKEERGGRIRIQSSFIPGMKASANNQADFSHVENVLKNDIKNAYANASSHFSVLNGSLLFYPSDKKDVLNVGYVSGSIWIEDTESVIHRRFPLRLGNHLKEFGIGGHWNGEVPIITINLESSYTAFGMWIDFRNTAPKEFRISTYKGNELIDDMIVKKPDLNYQSDKAFLDFDKMEIEFTKGYPNSRIFVDNIIIGDNTDYEISRKNELITAPSAVRQTKIQNINVAFSEYKESGENVVIVSEEILIPYNGYEYTTYFTRPSYNLSIFVNTNNREAEEQDTMVYAEIIERSNYYAKIRFTGVTQETEVRYSISGYEYMVEEQKYIKNYNKSGEIKEWNNPLISKAEHAQIIEEWLASYFLGDVEYEIDWKGDPAVDANDLFQLETRVGKSYIRDYENSFRFSEGRWTGNMKARKVAK